MSTQWTGSQIKAPQQTEENEIHVMAPLQRTDKEINEAAEILNNGGQNGKRLVSLRAMGRAIYRTICIAEILKRRIPGLHQLTKFASASVVDQYQPSTGGAQPTEAERAISSITIILSREPLDTNDPGYQRPLDQSILQSQEQQRMAELAQEGGEPPANISMENYEWAGSEIQAPAQTEENEIHVIAPLQRTDKELDHATQIINEGKDGKHLVSLRAMGRAIYRTICIAEILKRRVPGLHQITKFGSANVVDHYQPIQEGLQPQQFTRGISSITIILSRDPLNTNDPGYQSPLDQSLVQSQAQQRMAELAGEGGEPPANFSMENYEWAGSEVQAPAKTEENEIHVIAPLQRTDKEVDHAAQILNEGQNGKKMVSLRAMGRAIYRAVCIAEILKRHIPGLHQITKFGSANVIDHYQPTQEGLQPQQFTRAISSITIILSRDPLDMLDPGYQSPLDHSLLLSQQQQRMAELAGEGGEPPANFSMENYEWAGSEIQAPAQTEDNEIHVIAPLQRTDKEIDNATRIINEGQNGKHLVSLRAMGRAIYRTICIAEILKRRIPGLHQLTKFGSANVVDHYQPTQEGVQPQQFTRAISSITIILSRDPLNTNDPGYQPPLDQATFQSKEQMELADLANRGGEPPEFVFNRGNFGWATDPRGAVRV